MTRSEFIAYIAHDSDRIAQDALASGFLQDREADFAICLIRDVVDTLSRNPHLSERTQAHRLESLLLRVPLDQSHYFLPLAQMAQEFPSHFRVAVTGIIPDSIRPEVYNPESSVPIPTTGETPDAVPPMIRDDLGTLEEIEGGTVLLLSHPSHWDPNRGLLTGAKLDPLVVKTYDELQGELAKNTEVCGCVVDQSFLVCLDKNTQIKLFETLARYSSFMAIRVHDADGLLVSRDKVSNIIKRERQLDTSVPYDAITFELDGSIQETELSFFKNAAQLLKAHKTTPFVLGDLTSAEAKLLVAAVQARARAKSPDSEMYSGPITIRFLSGGQSGAKLVTVRCDEILTFVAKVTYKDHALEEMGRFRNFIQQEDEILRPEYHYHGEAAVILFHLIGADSSPATPAETLEKRLNDVWNEQWLSIPSPEELSDKEIFLRRALTHVAETLAKLNKQSPPPDCDLNTSVNPRDTHLKALDQQGFTWGLNDCAMEARRIAVERVKKMEKAAIVHGDIHLRNILIRRESEVYLIDFAASGPGHPAVDLVRYELALYLGPVRQFEDDKTCITFQKAFSIERASLDCLKKCFPDFFRYHINTACAAGMIKAHDLAIEVLGNHDGDIHDYLAMKLLVAWQHLGIIGSQTGLARAVIVPIAAEIAGKKTAKPS